MPNPKKPPPDPNPPKSKTPTPPPAEPAEPTYWYDTPNLPVRCLTDTSGPVYEFVPDYHRHDPVNGEELPF